MSKTLFVHIALLLMFVLPGLLALLVSVAGSKWFFESRSALFKPNEWGAGRARLFYALLGLCLLACGLWALWKTSQSIDLWK